MAAKIDQKAYLQKYLSGPSKDKKKKKKRVVKGTGLKIIDDDIDVTKLRPLDRDEFDVYGEGEDAPQIAGIIDDRPEELKKLEQFKTSTKWKVINQDDGFNSKLQVEEIKKDIKEVEKENEIIFGKMYSDSEDDEKQDSMVASAQKQSKEMQTQDKAKDRSRMAKNNSDSDLSPPRKQNEVNNTNSVKNAQRLSDSDASPPRRRETTKISQSRKESRSRESDLLIAKKQESKRQEKSRKPSRWGSHEDTNDRSEQNSARSTKHKDRLPKKSSNREYQRNPSSDSDMSPPRKSTKSDSNTHAQRKGQKNYDSDLSPPRKSRRELPTRNKSVDSDLSPPRQNKNSHDRTQREKKSNVRRKSSDSDLSPPRKRKSDNKTRKHSDDSDLSPPRRKNERESNKERAVLPRDRGSRLRRDSNSPPPTNKKMAKTLEGKLAGLQDARQLRQENQQFRQREEEAFSHMTDDVSGRNAQAVSRKKKRETSADRQKQSEKAERQKEIDEKYKKWGRGLKQQQAQEARLQDFIHEANKPLARYKDDGDLEGRLRDVEREGDPMLRYMREKKRQLGPEIPIYKGNFPPNRFNIRPGYRWDGVDRSNGYEKKYFDQQSKRKAQQEEAYKWSTEDL